MGERVCVRQVLLRVTAGAGGRGDWSGGGGLKGRRGRRRGTGSPQPAWPRRPAGSLLPLVLTGKESRGQVAGLRLPSHVLSSPRRWPFPRLPLCLALATGRPSEAPARWRESGNSPSCLHCAPSLLGAASSFDCRGGQAAGRAGAGKAQPGLWSRFCGRIPAAHPPQRRRGAPCLRETGESALRSVRS